jgi:hypothetical protein
MNQKLSKELRKLMREKPELMKEFREFVVNVVLDLQSYQAQNATAKA